jgi:hypothetical protein
MEGECAARAPSMLEADEQLPDRVVHDAVS